MPLSFNQALSYLTVSPNPAGSQLVFLYPIWSTPLSLGRQLKQRDRGSGWQPPVWALSRCLDILCDNNWHWNQSTYTYLSRYDCVKIIIWCFMVNFVLGPSFLCFSMDFFMGFVYILAYLRIQSLWFGSQSSYVISIHCDMDDFLITTLLT